MRRDKEGPARGRGWAWVAVVVAVLAVMAAGLELWFQLVGYRAVVDFLPTDAVTWPIRDSDLDPSRYRMYCWLLVAVAAAACAVVLFRRKGVPSVGV